MGQEDQGESKERIDLGDQVTDDPEHDLICDLASPHIQNLIQISPLLSLQCAS